MNASEDNILHLLDSATVAMILEDIEETATPENVTSTDLLIYVLMDQWCLLSDDVLAQLQYIDGVKWGSVRKDDLYPGLFTSRDELMNKCTLKDLKIICKTLEHHTNRCWFETGGVKSAHVNRIIRAFGGTDFVQETALHKRRQTYNPTTLKVAVKNFLLNDNYKLENLQIALGTVLAHECNHDWYERCTVNLKSLILFADGKEDDGAGEYVELFSYPEKNRTMSFVTRHLTTHTF